MKKLLLTLLLIAPALGLAQKDWSITQKDFDFFMKAPNGQQAEIFVDVGTPKIEKVEPIGEEAIKVIYYAGSVGTSQPVEVYRAAVFKKKDYQFLGSFPHHYKGNPQMAQPKWTVSGKSLHIVDAEEEIDTKLEL